MRLLQQLHDLTGELQTLLTSTLESEDEGVDLPDDEARIAALLDARQQLLDQIAALPPDQRHLTPATQTMLTRVQAQAGALLDALEARRQSLGASGSELSTAHTAIRAYLPSDQAESRYFEEQS